MKDWIFDDLFYKKGLLFIIWVLGMIKLLWSVNFLMKLGCQGRWGHWGHWGHWGLWGHWGFRGFKSLENHYWGLQSHPGRHLTSALCPCFEKKFFGVESRNIILNFSTFSVGGCWGQPMLFFWKLIDETQIPKPP